MKIQASQGALDPVSAQVLREVLVAGRSGSRPLDAPVYRAQHEDLLDLLDELEKQGYLRRKNETYLVTLYGLSVLDTPQAKDLLADCEKLWSIFRSRYKEDPRQHLQVADIAAPAKVALERALECLRYMVEGPGWSTYSLNVPDPATATVRPDEAILKYRTFRDVIEAMKRWKEKWDTQDMPSVMSAMAGRLRGGAIGEKRAEVEPVLGVEELHPRVRETCGRLIGSGHYENAVADGLKLVETYVREAIEADATVLGVDLMTKAFSGKDPPLKVSEIQAEQDGVHFLFRGAIAAFKNPHSHRFITVADLGVAMEHLAFVSLLLRLVDQAKARRTEI